MPRASKAVATEYRLQSDCLYVLVALLGLKDAYHHTSWDSVAIIMLSGLINVSKRGPITNYQIKGHVLHEVEQFVSWVGIYEEVSTHTLHKTYITD